MKFKVKSFLIKIIGGANIATILIALILGYSDRFDAAAHALLSSSGMAFPVFALLNAAFLLFWVLFWWRGIIIPVIGFVALLVAWDNYSRDRVRAMLFPHARLLSFQHAAGCT